MITMANMMLILLLITTSKCSNATQICVERNLTHCDRQEANGRCMSCDDGYYGPTCSSKCIGECDYDCYMDTGFCRQCKGTYYTKSCMVKCSDTCDEQLCNRTTGECTNGCEKGHCSDFCKTPCDESCKDKECNFETCKCQRCNDGFVCKEAAEGPSCTQCVRDIYVSVSTRDLLNTLLHILGMILIIGQLATNATFRRGFLKLWGLCKMGQAPRQTQHRELLPRNMALEQMFKNIPEDESDSEATVAMENRDKNQDGYSYPYDTNRVKLEEGEYINASHVDGDYDTQRYIATQQPVETQNDFWTMAWKYQTKVIVWLTSKQTSEFDRHLPNQKSSRTYGNIRIRHIKQNKETKCNCRIKKMKIKHVKENEAERDVTLYQFCGWFQEKSFCDFVMKVREDPNYETSPIVVFSKDGEGPTAVFLALDRYINKMTRGAYLHVDDLFVIVNDIACQRRGMFANKENIERIVKCHGHLKLLQGSIQPSPVPSEESTTKIICHGVLVLLIVVYFISAIAIIIYDHVG